MKKHQIHKYLREPYDAIKIHLIGAGGTGSIVLNNLMRINVTLKAIGKQGLHVTTFDFDTVEQPNIGRQNFFQNDVGQYKSDVITNRLNRAFGEEWNSIPQKYSYNHIEKYNPNIVIIAVDSVRARRSIHKDLNIYSKNTMNQENKLYYVFDIGNDHKSGQFYFYDLFNNYKNEQDIKPYLNWNKIPLKKDKLPSCSTWESIQSQDLFINLTLANFASQYIWELTTSYFIESRGMFVNLDSKKTQPIPL